MTDQVTLRQRLSDAEATLHKVMTGQSVKSITSDGRSVTYTLANVPDLRAYIAGLKLELGLSPGPIRPFF